MICSIGDRKVQCVTNNWYVAPNATVVGSVVLRDNASIWFNAVVRGDDDFITIGENSNVQDGAILHTDEGIRLTIGRDVTVGHLVMLHGCTVGDNCLIGIKSVILNNAAIGSDCLIGANTLIPERRVIPARSVVMGSPGKVIRSVTEDEIRGFREAAAHYVENARRYRLGLRAQPDLAG